jgi:hypothetical protein
MVAGLLPVAMAVADVLLRNGEMIQLEESHEYVALRLNEPVGASMEEISRAVLPGRLIDATPVLVQHHLVLIRISRNNSTSKNAAMRFGIIRKVYKTAGILVVSDNEILFKAKPGKESSALAFVSRFGKVEQLNNRGTYVLTLSIREDAVQVSNTLSRNRDDLEFVEPNFVTIANPLRAVP